VSSVTAAAMRANWDALECRARCDREVVIGMGPGDAVVIAAS
jgi:hypothetical protein